MTLNASMKTPTLAFWVKVHISSVNTAVWGHIKSVCVFQVLHYKMVEAHYFSLKSTM